jgi:DNA-binding NtrC family response regulator
MVVAVGRPQGADLETFQWLARQKSQWPLLAVIPSGAGDAAIQTAMQADDFVVHPFSAEELRHRVGRLLRYPRHVAESARKQLLDELGLANLVGRDAVFLQTVGQIPRFARSDAPVCITGETGTGKELCARALHHLSQRQKCSFIGVDCGALPEQLFENEMFGHVRGAFTDAHKDQKGLVAIARGGTLFLDEIDALSLSSQAKLLRFLQDRSYRPLGSEHFESGDVRIIAATNRDLEAVVREGRFRSDLFFRLNVLRLKLPALRDRRGDVELLANAALRAYWPVDFGPIPFFAPPALRALAAHNWPGNVRELYNVIQRAVVACEGPAISPEHLDLPEPKDAASAVDCSDFRAERAAAVAKFERRYVEDLLRKHNGNVTHAAREARQDRRAFGRFIKKYNIDRRALSLT